MKKKVKYLLSVAGLLFFTAVVLGVGSFINTRTNVVQHAASGTSLSLNPSTQTVNPGQDIFFSILMDTGPSKVTGLDIQLNFDPSAIQISSLKRGAGIGNLNNTISNNFDNNAGTIAYAVFTLDKTAAVEGTEIEVLQVRAKVVSDAAPGNSKVEFDASSAVSATNESRNTLTSTSPTTLTIELLPEPTATPTLTPVPTRTPVSTQTPGEPNSCGGTCGSNLNCGPNLFCYQGYCRKPSCSWSTDCSCDATPAPTVRATATPRIVNNNSTKTATPRGTIEPTIVEFTPEPETDPTPQPAGFWENIFDKGEISNVPTPTLEPVNLPDSETTNYLPWIIGSLIIAGVTLIFIVMGILKEAGYHKTKPPIIKV